MLLCGTFSFVLLRNLASIEEKEERKAGWLVG
jgi:hypothetical protein